MKTLRDLNAASLKGIEYSDDREPGITFFVNTPRNQTAVIRENQTHTIPFGVDIVEVIEYTVVEPTLIIDMTSMADTLGLSLDVTSFVWTLPTLPSYMSYVEDPLGYLTISGIRDVNDWNLLKDNIVVEFDIGFFGEYDYTVSIQYTNSDSSAQSTSWTVDLTILEVPYFDTATSMLVGANTTTAMTGVPTILDFDVSPDNDFTLMIIPQQTGVEDITSSFSNGASVTFADGELTIVGSREDINQHLANLSIEVGNIDYDITLRYTISNDVSSIVDVTEQTLESKTYNLSRTKDFFGNQVNEFENDLNINVDVTGDLTLLIEVTDGEILLPGLSISNSVYKSGNREAIVTALNSLEYYPDTDQSGDETMTFTLRTGLNNTTGAFISQNTKTLDYQGNGNTESRVIEITSTQSWTPDYADVKYKNFDVVLVGAGGAGGTIPGNTYRSAGLAGGAGGAFWIEDVSISYQSYSLTVGTGGTWSTSYTFPIDQLNYPGEPGSDGGNTVGFGYTVAGGRGATIYSSGRSGYPSGSSTVSGVSGIFPTKTYNSQRKYPGLKKQIDRYGNTTTLNNYGGGAGVQTDGFDGETREYLYPDSSFTVYTPYSTGGTPFNRIVPGGGSGVDPHPTLTSKSICGGGGAGGVYSPAASGAPAPSMITSGPGGVSNSGGDGATVNYGSTHLPAENGLQPGGGGGGGAPIIDFVNGTQSIMFLLTPGNGADGIIYIIVKD